ncbi:MAG: MraY family glycosyltransferase [Hyphomicrobiaceae bacterium]
MMAVIGLLLAFVLALGLVRLLFGDVLSELVLDIPNDRSLHTAPVPRTGGVGVMLAFAIAMVLVGSGPAALVVPGLLLAGIFLIDDVRGLPVPVRFGVQFAAALLFLVWSGPYSVWLWPFLLLGLVWSAHLYNFMDGSNGLAGGMAVIGFGAYAIAAFAAGASDLAVLCAAVAGASAGFLWWNYDPARIFLGDAGSIPLGFLAAGVGVLGWQRGLWPFWFPPLVFSFFIVDSGLTLAKRLVHRENPFEAHRSHYYQRLIRMGWSHGQMALTAYALMFAAASTALLVRPAPAGLVIPVLATWCVASGVMVISVDRMWRASPVRGR